MSIGKRIKQRRQELRLSQLDIAYHTNISSGNISNIEAEKSLPSAQALIKLSEILDCSIDWILLGNTKTSEDSPLLEEYIKKFKMLDQKNQEEILEIIKLKLRMGKGKK